MMKESALVSKSTPGKKFSRHDQGSPTTNHVTPRLHHATLHNVTSRQFTSRLFSARHATSHHITAMMTNCVVSVWGFCTGIMSFLCLASLPLCVFLDCRPSCFHYVFLSFVLYLFLSLFLSLSAVFVFLFLFSIVLSIFPSLCLSVCVCR